MAAHKAQAADASSAGIGGQGAVATSYEECTAVLTLDGRGMICDCNRAGEALFKYRRRELVWRHVSMLIPQLAALNLLQNGQPNPSLRFLCRIGRRFQAVAHDGERFAADLFLNLLDNAGNGRLSLILRLAEDTPGNEPT